MMNQPISRATGPALLCLVLLSSSASSWSQWQNQLGVHTDYFYRGLTYREQPSSISWLSEYRFDNGIYTGLWANKHNDSKNFRGTEELDYWVGFIRPVSRTLAIDVSFTKFSYPNERIFDYAWREALLSLHVEQYWTFAAGINKDQFRSGDEGYIVEATRRSPWLSNLIDISLGYAENDAFDYRPSPDELSDDHGYLYYELGISRVLKPMDQLRMRMALVGTDKDNTSIYGQWFADREWAFSLQYHF